MKKKNIKKIAICLGLPLVLGMTGCKSDEEIKKIQNAFTNYAQELGQNSDQALLTETEYKIEENILKTINEAGAESYKFDVKTFDAVKKNDYYLVLNGDLISDISAGRQNGCVVFNVNEDNYKKIGDQINILVRSGYVTHPGTMYEPISNDSFAWQKYGDAINDLKVVLEDESTKLYSVQNLDTNEMLYSQTANYTQEMGL